MKAGLVRTLLLVLTVVVSCSQTKQENQGTVPAVTSDNSDFETTRRQQFSATKALDSEMIKADWRCDEFDVELENFDVFECFNKLPGDEPFKDDEFYFTGKWSFDGTEVTLTVDMDKIGGTIPDFLSKEIKNGIFKMTVSDEKTDEIHKVEMKVGDKTLVFGMI